MISSAKNIHPFKHQGTSQLERLVSALIPENFKIDSSTIEEIISSTNAFASLLGYHNEYNQVDGDWTCFWEVEPITFLAIVSGMNTDKVIMDYQLTKSEFHALPPDEHDENTGNNYALTQIKYIKTLAIRIENYFRFLPDEIPLKSEILAIIQKNSLTDSEQLASALYSLISFHKEAFTRATSPPEDLKHHNYAFFFSEHWEIADPPEFYQIPFNTDYLLNGFELLDELVKVFHQALVKIKARAHFWFEQTMSNPEVKKPHIALFLAFLQLFEYARTDLNNLNKAHLEYYFREILHLQPAKEVPDQVHLLFELANNVDQQLIQSGTEILAGKDANGKPLIFETVKDWVVNNAQVVDLKNTYLNNNLGKLFSNPDINQKYCKQQSLPNTTANEWQPMGADDELPFGEYGFAVGSPQLILEEGNRSLSAIFYLNPGFPYIASDQLNIAFSTEEAWKNLSPLPNDSFRNEAPTSSGYQLVLSNVEMKIGPFEMARRIAAEVVSDIPEMLATQESVNAEIVSLYERTGASLKILNEYVLQSGYDAIHILNQAINGGMKLGEYFYLRAYFYWSLAKTFAPPINTALDASGNRKEIKTNLLKYVEADDLRDPHEFELSELWDQIINDLKAAKRLIKPNHQSAINRSVVNAFLARVYFQMGNYEAVINESKALFERGTYGFSGVEAPNVFEFTGEFHKEAIWWYDIANEGFEDLTSIINWKSSNGKISSKRVLPCTQTFLESINWIDDKGELNEKVVKNDPRFAENFKYVPAGEDPDFQTSEGKLWCNKYNRRTADKNNRITILKITEVAFNYIHALLKTGNNALAKEVFNQYRASRGMKAMSSIKEETILRERSIEMAFEGDRRDYFQSLAMNIPADEHREKIDWNSEKLYAEPSDLKCIDVGLNSNLSFKELRLEAKFLEDFPPIVAFKTLPTEKSIVSPWPILKLTFNQTKNFTSDFLSDIRKAKISKIDLNVAVKGIRENLVVHSDVGVFDGKQEFLPFGPSPKKGKLFRVGSTEAMRKSLENLKLNFTWIDPPDLTYDNYTKNYVNQGKTKLSESTYPFPDLKIDFQNNASQVPQSGGNLGGTNFITNLFFDSSLDTISGKITTITGEPIENVYVIPIFQIELSVAAMAPAEALEKNQISNAIGEFEIPVDNNIVGLRFEPVFPEEKGQVNLRYYVQSVNTVDESSENVDLQVILRPYFLFDMVHQNQLVGTYEIDHPFIGRYGDALDFEAYAANLPQGFVQLEMVNGDFMHRLYPHSLTFQAINTASGGEADLPLPPYTPTTNGISLDYRSRQSIEIGEQNDGIDQFFHILPNEGYNSIQLTTKSSDRIDLVYPYQNHDGENAKFASGHLYIGLENLIPGANLSLLFQMREGSQLAPDWQSPAIHWSILGENNKWIPFGAAQILSDTSLGLTRTGMIQFEIPTSASNITTLFGQNLYWIHASAIEDLHAVPPRSPKALPQIINVHSQAIVARFDNRENQLDHLNEPLPPDMVTKLVTSRSEIKKISQPFPSFGGKIPEEGNQFYRRISERLRHKDRTVTIWDYERQILERFDKIFKAKCFSHSNLSSTVEPGHVLLAVIPDLNKRDATLQITPRFSRGDLKEMEDYLRQKSNLFSAYVVADDFGNLSHQYIHVANPIYEPIQLEFEVRFQKGFDANFHKFLLDEELRLFLAPWLGENTFDIGFDRSMSRSEIIQFIEERPYVDIVLKLKIKHCDALVPQQQNVISPSSPRSILTAHIASGKHPEETDHQILIISHADHINC